jgi:nucleotide-binding universal stress UspA family protein
LADRRSEAHQGQYGRSATKRPHADRPWDDREVHAAQLAEAQRLLDERGVTAELIESSGDGAKVIERVAQAGGFDVIVVGARPMGALARFLQGGVSGHVATHATTSVLVAR